MYSELRYETNVDWMKKRKTVVLLFLVFVGFLSCERDDICVEGDTPLLVITFFDIDDPETPKSVPTLRIRGVGFEPDAVVDTFDDRTTLDSIGIPLDASNEIAPFVMITGSADNDDDLEIGNLDTLAFTYIVREAFISRACGFVANYDDLASELTIDTDNWIQDVIVDITLVENQTQAHVKILH